MENQTLHRMFNRNTQANITKSVDNYCAQLTRHMDEMRRYAERAIKSLQGAEGKDEHGTTAQQQISWAINEVRNAHNLNITNDLVSLALQASELFPTL